MRGVFRHPSWSHTITLINYKIRLTFLKNIYMKNIILSDQT